jgi:predicted TPR repeat methyltransferase
VIVSQIFAQHSGRTGSSYSRLSARIGGGADFDYRLGLHGRYSHTRAYVEQLLAFLGLQPEIAHAELRMESGAPVAGLVIRATKSVAAGP